jgi:transcriptional regulator with XRE-family HTH domain
MGGDLIKEARKRAGLTQAELAARAGTTQSAIARWERSAVDPGFDTVRRLVRLCGFHLEVALHPWEDGMADDLHHAHDVLARSVEGRYDDNIRKVRMYQDLRAEAKRSMRHAG